MLGFRAMMSLEGVVDSDGPTTEELMTGVREE